MQGSRNHQTWPEFTLLGVKDGTDTEPRATSLGLKCWARRLEWTLQPSENSPVLPSAKHSKLGSHTLVAGQFGQVTVLLRASVPWSVSPVGLPGNDVSGTQGPSLSRGTPSDPFHPPRPGDWTQSPEQSMGPARYRSALAHWSLYSAALAALQGCVSCLSFPRSQGPPDVLGESNGGR